MTETTTPDMADAMSRLLEQELMASIGVVAPAADRPAAAAATAPGVVDNRLEDDVVAIAAAALRMPVEHLLPTENLANFGIDSIAITEIMVQISRVFGISVAPTTFFEARHLNDLARILRQRHGTAIEAHYARRDPPPAPPAPAPAQVSSDAAEIGDWLRRHRALRRPAPVRAETGNGNAPVAIIAMEGRFPQSPDLDALERHLAAGDDCISEVPPERWDWRAVWGDPRQGPFTQVKWGGFVDGIDRFDAASFNIAPREAELIDPQHRLFIECVWSLIERGGYAPGGLSGKRVGLFLGINLLDYTAMINRAGLMDAQKMTGLGHCFCPNRLSFLLDVHGPSQAIDTACSSAAVALHRAVMSIRHEGCEMAIAGGSNLILSPEQHILFSQLGMLSPGGRCRPFGRDTDGYARADGVGAVLLKRLDLAERDGDPILGVILASAEHHGGTATSLTAPNPAAQARMIADAHRQAGIDPRSVTLVECHGTGTRLGDPVEIEGLKTAFADLYAERGLPPAAQPHCGLGSIKSNIGHSETTAGLAGLIKILLAMRSGTQYRSLHCEPPNPLIDLTGTPFRLLDQARPWTRPVIDGAEMPRRAGLSSFGAGGANVHLVIEEYRPAKATAPAPGPRPLVVPVSARSEDGLRRLVAALRPLVATADLDDFAYTLQTGRDALSVRVAFVVRDAADLARQMDAFVAGSHHGIAYGTPDRRRSVSTITDSDPARIAARWVAGDFVDWSRLWSEGRRHRLALPPTPFESKRFWLPVAETETKATATATPERVGLPPLKESGPDRWRVGLTGREVFLTDHRLGETPVLPGVVYLELARAAAGRAGLTVGALRNVVWIRPLSVTAPTEIEIRLDRAAARIEILGRDDILHAQIRLDFAAPAPGERHDLAALEAAQTAHYSAEQVYAIFDRMGLHYGPGHRAIEHLSIGPGPQVLARLTLPPALAGSLESFGLHPSLLDGAFQSALGMALAEGPSDSAALPFAIDRVEPVGALAPVMWAYLRPAAESDAALRVRSHDIDLIGEDGTVRVRLRGFATRLPEPQSVLTFAPRWQPLRAMSAPPAARRVLWADDIADPAVPLETRYALVTTALLAEMQGADGLVQLVCTDDPAGEPLSGALGLLRSATQERPKIGGQVVIVPAGLDRALVAARLEEAALAGAGARLRLENGTLWQEGWEDVAAAPASPPWRDGKVYLITGGLGGLGRQLTRAIRTAAPQAVVVLAGRRLGEEAQGWLAAQGEAVRFVPVDLTDADAVAALIEDIRRRDGRLDGVIHAAGLLRDGTVAGKSAATLAEVLAPKVDGTLHLDRALGDAPLDFFVLFSSVAGVWGSFGQADYAAANAFLDGFAAAREVRRRAGLVHGRTVAIAWPLWAEGGMTIDAETRTMMTRTTGLVPLGTAEGLAALAAALVGSEPRLLVLAGDAERLRRRMEGPPAAKPAATVAAGPAAAPPGLEEKLLAALIGAAAHQLKVSAADLASDEELTAYGFDSIGFTQFANALNLRFGLDLTPTLFFEYPTLAALAAHLSASNGASLAEQLGIAPVVTPIPVVTPTPAPVQVTLATPAIARATPPAAADDPVAIIGFSGVFPQAADVSSFWANLEAGRDCIGEVPSQRWDWQAAGTLAQGGFIDGIDRFDAGFFGLSAPEARMIDPQQRLLLTQAWRLFEDAGIPARKLAGTDTGVFIGIADTGYGRLLAQSGAGIEGYAMTGLAPSLGPNRISFHFDLHGPSVAIETACSSALVALHRAALAIRDGTCEVAIAGGINTLLLPDSFIGFAKAGMLAADGRCKTFSDAANGYARGEGVGLVLLKRLSAARRDGNRITAVIRASGENHGGRASSLTAPNPRAQADLLRATYARAGFDPRTLGYIEAHGTGTPLGDPIEVEALRAAFADLTRDAERRFGPAPAMACGLGSVKSNIGHLELAAGIAGLIKVLLQMRHGTLVKTLHCERLNPYLKLDDSPFEVIRETRPWSPPVDGAGRPLPRRAGISSFGFGGTNAHVVIEEMPPEPEQTGRASPGPALLVLSAQSEEALRRMALDLRGMLDRHDLADIAFSLQTRRDALEHRLGFVAGSPAEAALRLDAFLAGTDDPALHLGRVRRSRSAVSVLESDAEVARAIAGLAGRGRADGLIEVWAKGFPVDWTLLYGESRPRAVDLPGYPLAETRYWPDHVAAPQPVAAVLPPTPQPEPVEESVEEERSDEADPVAAARAALTEIAARVLEVGPEVLDPDAELGEFGFDSITMTGFAAKVNAELGLSLTPADFFEFATLNRLARHIAGSVTVPRQPKPAAPRPAAPLRVAPIPAVVASAPVPRAPAPDAGDPIAIVGFSCCFPKARDGDAFWDNLKNGQDCITRIPADRWDWQAFDGDPKVEQGKTNIHWGGFIEGVFEFDPLFFGISPREAKLMDPQQRLVMMHVWKAIEDSGHAPRSLAGRRVGLFVGTSSSGYRDIIGDDTGAEGYVATGAVPSIGPNRISYFLDWHGPSEPVETACSSTLVALHRAIQAMRGGDCDMAVVGGVNTIVTPEAHINFAKAGMLSPDGRCKTFSAQANGYVRGEGVGMVVLKFLSEAERDGDPILALVRGSAVNHGGRANSLTAPNTAAQTDLLREAQARAGLDPATIGYIEAHGTGTPLGDPVEINALKAAFRDTTGARIGIGSVKTNIGHLELAAGAAGLIKVLLQMEHATLAPSLHCAEINPYIDLGDGPFRIVRAAEAWQPATDGQGRPLPRRAGLSSFGFGGVNAHVILEHYQHPPAPARPRTGPVVIVLSARDGDRLRDQARNLLEVVASGRIAETDLDDLAYTLQVGRDAMRVRWAAAIDSLAQLRERLTAFLNGETGDTAKLEAGHKAGAPLDPSLPAATLATRWLAGDTVDWAARAGNGRRRLRLPTYPFARDSYHINASFAGSAAAVRKSGAFTWRLSCDDFVLRDHRVGGARLLPGAMGLELARAAFAAGAGFAPVVLRRVVWQSPLRLDQGSVTATLPLGPAEDGAFAVRLLSGGPDSIPHMLGLIAPLGAPAPAPLDLAALRQRCPDSLDVETLYRRFRALGLEYGPAFRALAALHVGEGAVLAQIRLPDAAAGTSFALHPSIVDAAFQAVLGLFPAEGGTSTAIPFGLDEAEVFAPTQAAMWAFVRRAESSAQVHRFDIDLADDSGRLCQRLSGFSLRELKKTARSESDSGLRAATLAHLAGLVAREANVAEAEVEAEATLDAYGIDSVMIVRLTDALEADFSPLPKTLFFEYRTLEHLSGYFLAHHRDALVRLLGGAEPPPPPPPLAPPPAGGNTPPDPARAAPLVAAAETPIAIIGMAGRFPGADDLDGFWHRLESGFDGITEIPAERWDHARFYDPKPGIPGKTNSKWGGFLDGVECFDPLFFNIAPREANYIDPQDRLFLQCAWETLENAGYTRASLPRAASPMDGGDVGIFVGVMYEEYQLYGAERTQAGQPLALSGSAASIANRVSSFCGFHGPSLAVDTMCSSSLTALHLACESLRAGSCRMALAGGVNLTLHPNKYLALAQGRFLSSSGRCGSFGEGGDGYVPGEGVGAVLLKPLAEAEADGDRILGIIRASALNHGGHTNGYTVPNPAAQAAVIGRALAAARLDPRLIGYVEAHGTGTKLGDPIEIAALTRAFGAYTADTGFCAIGSVKSNIGHCESAAGIAGLAKVLLQMRHRTLVPSLHSRVLNSGIDFARTPFVVQQQAAPWPQPRRGEREEPRRAGLSSFGAGGANAHVIVEEYLPPPQPVQPPRRHVFVLSARDPDRLAEATTRLRARLDRLAEADLAALAWTLQTGREGFEERLAIVADSKEALIAALDRGDGVRGRAKRGQGRVATGEAATLAAAWVGGAEIDWRALWVGPVPTRLALPTYPFARERYWVPGLPLAATPATPRTVDAAPALPLFFAPRWSERAAAPGALPLAETRLVVLVEPPATAVAGLTEALAPAEVVTLAPAPYPDQAARLLDLIQALFRRRPESALVQLVVPPDSRHEGLAGLLRCARLERPGLLTQTVALDLSDPDAAARLRADQASGDAEIRHRGAERRVRHWQSLRPAAAAPSPWRAEGTYLITGGLGGIGRHLCAHIRRHAPKASLWLVGRSAPADCPVGVEYRQADVGDGAAMAALVAEIVAKRGGLDGIVHAAGITRDSLLIRKSEADLRAVLAPKVAGTLALDAATASLKLDFLALFASASGALGNPGQADYAAANAYLDSFAAHRNLLVAQGERHGRTLSIDWPYWQDGGMRQGAETIAAIERATGIRPLDSAAGLAGFDALLGHAGEDQVLVLEGDPARINAMLDAAPPAAPIRAQAPASPSPSPSPATLALVTACFAEVLRIAPDRLAPDATIDRFGVDSVSALEIVAALERQVGPLPPTILFEHPTLAQLATALGDDAARPEPAPPAVPTQAQIQTGDIAIVAMAGRYPGADSPEALWAALEDGRDLVGEVPPDRWDPAYSPIKGQPGTSHCKWGGFLDDIEGFDAAFFGYSPRAAALADPQERLFLETVWDLLERAGETEARRRERYESRVGVFVGAMYQHYGTLDTDPDSKALVQLASYSAIANRVSFVFDLQGPSVAVDSMCSSGLQAVHQAVQSLRAGECRLAVAGAVNLSLGPAKYQGLSRAGLVGSAPDSRSFAEGDGYLPAEGVGAVLLKPLADARRDGDAVLAVIKASAANHGGHSAGFGVPSADAQARLIEETIRAAAIDPATIGYVEAAANGAALADSIELRALTRAFRRLGRADGSVALGAVKSNMGHAEAASGLAQLTKVLLQLQHHRLAATRRPARLNPALDFAASPFRPVWENTDWPAPEIGGTVQPRRAALSSFGAGGSNVHLVIEEAPAWARESAPEPRQPRRFPVSARTPEQLAERLRGLAAFVRATPALSLARLSATLRLGRETMEHAMCVVASDRDDLAAKLERARPGDPPETKGAPDPDEIDRDEAGPMLVLPPYPFARERAWLPPPRQAHRKGTDLAALVTGCLAAELGVTALDPAASFAALGLDSMILLRLGYAVEEATGIRLDRRAVEQAETPAGLIAWLAGQARPESAPPPPVRAAGPWRIAMTEGQKGLWVVQSLHPDSVVYNVPLAFRLDGIDLGLLERACRWLLETYPVLTARVEDPGDAPALVAQPVARPLERVELPKGMDPVDFARTRSLRPFDLGAGPPCRIELLHGGALGGGSQILLLLVHHIVFDGASGAVVAAALWDAYGRLAQGLEPVAPDGADFSAFAAWERERAASPAGVAQAEYWRRHLAGPLPVVELPADRPGQPGAAIDGRSLERRIEPERTSPIKAAATRLGISPAAFLLSALAALIHRHTGLDDIVIGVPTLRRPERRFARTVGYCVNMIALRVGLSGSDRADRLVRAVQSRLIEGLDHSDVPFAAIARDLSRSAPGEPPYQISFAYQNFPLAAAAPLPPGSGHAAFLPALRQPGDSLFGLEIHEVGDGWRLVAGYDGTRFDPATIECLLDRFVRLTEAMARHPQERVRDLDLIAPSERKRLLGRHSNPPALARRSGLVADWIADRAKTDPDAIAVQAGDEQLSYRRLVRRANRLARHLRAHGVRRGDCVAVALGREADSIVVLLACLTLGAVWVPLDIDAPPARLAAMLADCAAKAVVTRSGTLAAPDSIDLDRDAAAIAARPARRPRSGPRPSDPAYMIYTSGSTGAPKGVVVSHRALADHVGAIAHEFGLTAADRVLHFAPQFVDTALEQIVPTLVAGARVLMRTCPAWSPDDLARVLCEERVSVADLPPAYLREVLLAWGDVPPPPALRLLIVGGEALSADTVRLWQRGPLASVKLLNAYGPTEATITCLTHAVEATVPPGAAVPIGRPLPGTRVLILDSAGALVPEGVIGEVYVGGTRLALGYHNRPDLTAERFIDSRWGRLYRTGDLGAWSPGDEPRVAFHGRIDDQVKIRGFRVELSEVEAALAGFGLRETAVVARPDGRLLAYAVPFGESWDEAALRAHMAARLPAHMLPSAYVRLTALPLTANGKLDRAALPEPARAVITGDVPQDGLERQMVEIWARVLGREPATIGIHDDFVLCGGHSLAWVRLLNEIGRSFGWRPAAADILAAQTVAEQAAVLRAGRPDHPADSGAPVALRPARGTARLPLFLVHAAAGTVTCYRDLARRLAPAVPVYGLEADGSPPAADLPALAARHVAALQRLQPHGPYRLAGWSMGGVLAFEMARHLHRNGETVSLLCLIDSYLPAEIARFESALAGGDGDPVERAFRRDVLGGTDVLLPGDEVRSHPLFATFCAQNEALMAYVPAPLDVPLTLLRAGGGDAAAPTAWRTLAAAGLTVLPVAGDHDSLLRPPHLESCAARLDAALAASDIALSPSR
ncbi:non-ribosomal peptide synthetase [Magnetospirillum fulvum]|uniref:Amino acid adenylation domain-containing protein n=1 Tax=Magnetospirillum fulvum TaxID=1082 RepID=A0A1H6I2M0_MAGFU|nr:non-ribosomal peptide synthetase [Magnetospirillum fulvum]SEH40710.1 amino acid adenylation domain-containing protein [Magnetospirillum fulvum]